MKDILDEFLSDIPEPLDSGLNLSDFDEDLSNDRFPYPYIFNPPKPPDDFAMAPQLQQRAPLTEKEPEEEIYCQYCGIKLTKEEQITHSCKKKPKNT